MEDGTVHVGRGRLCVGVGGGQSGSYGRGRDGCGCSGRSGCRGSCTFWALPFSLLLLSMNRGFGGRFLRKFSWAGFLLW